MRLTSVLLLASASSAFGQFTRFTNSSFSAVESATSFTSSVPTTTTNFLSTTITRTTNRLLSSSSIESTSSIETTTTPSASSVASFALDLRNAVLGPGASFYPPPNGDSILFSPVASDSTLNRRQRKPLPIPIPLPIAADTSFASFKSDITRDMASAMGISANRIINVTLVSSSGSRKRAEYSSCVFEVFVDGEVTLAVPITGSFGNLELSTNPVPPKDSYDLVFRQSCNGENIDIVLEGAAIQNGQSASSTPIPSIIIGTPTGISETSSADLTTNSEGETIFPTETTPAASSEAATTPSYGETVLTTGTATGANSGSATTNSESKTIFPTEITTGASSAGGSTNTEGDTVLTAGTATSTSTSATATLPAGFPGEVGDFTLFGCVASTAGFPTFALAQSNPKMDLNICATLCAGRAYFGVYDAACYCGDKIDAADTSRVDLDQCDIECPGDNTQFCGGESNSKLRARQAIPSNLLLTVYVAIEADVTLTESVTQTVTDQKTVVTTFTTTITGALSIATEVITTTLVCFTGKCHSINSDAVDVYTFVEIKGSDHNGQWVYISEPCSCAGGQRYIPKFCFADNCASIKVFTPQRCPDWYNYNLFFIPTDCSTCPSGKIVYQPWENSWGTPDNCNDAVPTCSGYDCPSQQNAVRPHQGVDWNATIPHGASGGGSNSSPNNGDSGSSQAGSSSGSNNGYSSPGSNGEFSSGSNTSPDGSPNSGSNGGSGSGSQGESQSSDIPGSKGSYPSTVPVISGASSYDFSVISFLAVLVTLL